MQMQFVPIQSVGKGGSFRRWPGWRRAWLVAWLASAGTAWAETPAVSEPLLVEGRFSCSVRRPVLFPFGGVVDELTCKVGQAVTNGQPLVRYRLFPDAAQQLCRRLNPPHAPSTRPPTSIPAENAVSAIAACVVVPPK